MIAEDDLQMLRVIRDVVLEQCAEHAAQHPAEPPTFNAAAACGCLGELTNEHEVVVQLCGEHQAVAPEMDAGLRQALDYELDNQVREHAGGRRVNRIWGDPQAERR